MKGCGAPSKGNVGAREHAYSHCLIVPLSLLVAEGAVLKPEHRKCDRRRTAGLLFQVHILAALHIVGITSYRRLLNFYRIALQRWSEFTETRVFCPTV